MRILVVGSLNFDLVTKVKTVPRGGETIHADDFNTYYGGKGANQVYAIRRLVDHHAASVAIVGSVGKDAFGQELLEHLEKAGVDVSEVTQLDDERTGVASILVEEDGENRIMVYPGANGKVLDVADKITDDVDFVVLQNEIPLKTTFEVLEKASQNPRTRSVLNPSPLPHVPLREFPYIDVLVTNEGEAAALTGKQVDSRESATAALPDLLSVSGLSVITLGANGVVWQEKNKQPGFQPSHKVSKVVDTTGAGDTFLAALVSQLVNPQLSMEERISFAAKAAAIAVTREGAASSIPSLEEVNN